VSSLVSSLRSEVLAARTVADSLARVAAGRRVRFPDVIFPSWLPGAGARVMAAGQCKHGLHLVPGRCLTLQSPSGQDLRVLSAGAADPDAQRWLGWSDQQIERARRYTGPLDVKPGKGAGGPLPQARDSKRIYLAAVAPETQRLAGAVVYNGESGDVTGWLLPEFRGRGLGTALFAGAAEFVHHHLGLALVVAGTEPDNKAAVAALTAAGFTEAAGPQTRTLDDSRTVTAAWFRHDDPQPVRCTEKKK
jgi:RimJ/RimL family protein N-acetyltransferase